MSFWRTGIDSLLNLFHTLYLVFQNIISKRLQEAEEEAKPAYASKSSNDGDSRPKYGSRKEFFQRVWDRLHGSEGKATASTQTEVVPEFDGSTLITTSSNDVCNSELVHPIPIRYAIPFSSSDVSAPSCFDIHHDHIESIGTQHLIDDKYQRVTVRDISPTSNETKTRHFSAFSTISGAFPTFSPQSKKPKVGYIDM